MLSKACARHVLEEIIKLYPNAKPALNYSNHFELLVSVMLSAQTTDEAVNKVTPDLFKKFPNPEAVVKSSPEEIEPYLKSIGLYRNKSKFLYQMSKQLVDQFKGEVPHTRKELESLSGVGRKTANVVLSIAFDTPAFAVDTHITRICKHHKIVPENATTLQIEKRVTEVLPPKLWTQAHLSMLLFGRNICHPRNPECHNYPQLYDCTE